MSESFRTEQILRMARQDGSVTTDRIASAFGVTVQTARRDLTRLCAAGQLVRVHGGAVLPLRTGHIDRPRRRELQTQAKLAIARKAAAQIPDGASVFLDIGTTLEAVAEIIAARTGLMIITNNLHVANRLSETPDIDVIVAGGTLRPSDGGLVGEVTAGFMRQFRPDIALMGASALSLDGDALDHDFREVCVAQAVIGLARRTLLLADSSKFERHAPVRIGRIADFDAFVTDLAPPAPVARACESTGCEILVP